MDARYITILFFMYGLAFFSMGLAILLEMGRGSESNLRGALGPLAIFGFLHGGHEWLEMFQFLHMLPGQEEAVLPWGTLLLSILVISFISLSVFGSLLITSTERARRLSLLVPLSLATIWAFGLFILKARFPGDVELLDVADVWTRYILGVPSAVLACAGLIVQQREFRKVGMAQFGRDSLWAAVAFAWYGVIGQTFTKASLLPPSTVVNEYLFLELFGFPVQALRGAAAVVVAVFVVRSLRAFEVERRQHVAELQAARLQEAQRRETLRGELLKRVVDAQEAERQRIARELHDETGQALTALGLGLRSIRLAEEKTSSKSADNLKRLREMVARTMNELQRLISDLRPSHIDDLGLPAALRWYANDLQTRAPLKVHVTVDGKLRPIPSPGKITLYRVAQEALTNVIKHSGADEADVRLQFGDKNVTLEVEDDGSGFDIDMLRNPERPSWGLLGMEERASLLGGRFRISSQPGKGTRVEVTIPYEQERPGDDENTHAVGG
jgi:signal transduction histidine kinase